MNSNILTIYILVILTALSISTVEAKSCVFSRTRHKAGLLALIAHNESPTNQRNYTCKKAQISGICKMMVQEGGYDPKRVCAILNISDPEVEYVAMIMEELQGERKDLPRLGSMVLASSVAFAYTVPSADGMRAAVHAGRLGGVDEDCDAVCRAVYSLIVYAVEGKIDDKDDLIKVAALNADSERVSRGIRSVRLAEWRKLPKESTLLGRLMRVLYLWKRCKGYSDAISLGNRKLLYPESRKLLAVLSACWTDLPYLPENFVWKALMEKDIREICSELYKLSDEAILAGVPEQMVYGNVNAVFTKSTETINGKAVGSGNEYDNDMVEFAQPQSPAIPRTPAMPNSSPVYSEEVLHVDLTKSPPSLGDIQNEENSELTAIEPLEPITSNNKKIRVVNTIDPFADSFFAQ